MVVRDDLWFWCGRGPGQVLLAHGAALLSGAPGALFGSFGADAKKAFSSDALLALIYSYPLFAVAILTTFLKVRTAQDFIGGIALMALRCCAVGIERPAGHARFPFGAGTAPRMFGVLMLALGAGIALVGLVADGPGLSHYAWRGPLFVSAGDPVHLRWRSGRSVVIVSAFASFMIAALGTHETRWIEAVIVGACLTAGCAILFPYILGLPMPMWPAFPDPVRA